MIDQSIQLMWQYKNVILYSFIGVNFVSTAEIIATLSEVNDNSFGMVLDLFKRTQKPLASLFFLVVHTEYLRGKWNI